MRLCTSATSYSDDALVKMGRAPLLQQVIHNIYTCCRSPKFGSQYHQIGFLQAIEAFQKDLPTTVFILSMRSGAVGINLTAANHVFLMEPAFNPALEDQAVGRAHRMGQTRPVTVKKFFIKVHIGSGCRQEKLQLSL